MFQRKCKITFIAHGSTVFTEEQRLSADNTQYPPLNDRGEEEIKKIIEFIKKRGLKTDRIYSSPVLCCTQSAGMIADEIPEIAEDFEVVDNLYNCKFGDFSGLTLDEIEKKYPGTLDKMFINPIKYWPESAEHLLDFNKRIEETIFKIIEKNIRGRIIIVTHPPVIQSAIRAALNIPPEHQYKIRIQPASATQINYFSNWAGLVYSNHIPL